MPESPRQENLNLLQNHYLTLLLLSLSVPTPGGGHLAPRVN